MPGLEVLIVGLKAISINNYLVSVPLPGLEVLIAPSIPPVIPQISRFSPVAGIRGFDRSSRTIINLFSAGFSPVAGIRGFDRVTLASTGILAFEVSVPLPGLEVLIAQS